MSTDSLSQDGNPHEEAERGETVKDRSSFLLEGEERDVFELKKGYFPVGLSNEFD